MWDCQVIAIDDNGIINEMFMNWKMYKKWMTLFIGWNSFVIDIYLDDKKDDIRNELDYHLR